MGLTTERGGVEPKSRPCVRTVYKSEHPPVTGDFIIVRLGQKGGAMSPTIFTDIFDNPHASCSPKIIKGHYSAKQIKSHWLQASALLNNGMESQTHLTASELIQARSSWRSCTGEAIPDDKLKELESYVRTKTTGIFGSPLRFELAAAREGDSEELKGLGTYGFIRGASAFIIGAIDREIHNLEDYGYLMQDIILFATGLNLATCWLGGSFRKDNFSARINVQDHEFVPAVVSVGLPAENRNLVDRIIRNVAGSKKRKPWEELFLTADFTTPLSRNKAGEYAHVLEMVRLSPSASNKQPWRYVLDNDRFHLYLQRTPGYRKKNLFSDLQRIDMGISMHHFASVCDERDLGGEWVKRVPSRQTPEGWEPVISWMIK